MGCLNVGFEVPDPHNEFKAKVGALPFELGIYRLLQSNVFSKILEGKDYPEVVKTRYNWLSKDGMIWEVDEFEGNLAGLIIAEVELPNENHVIELPSWLGMEITYAKGWSNADLAKLVMTAQNN